MKVITFILGLGVMTLASCAIWLMASLIHFWIVIHPKPFFGIWFTVLIIIAIFAQADTFKK